MRRTAEAPRDVRPPPRALALVAEEEREEPAAPRPLPLAADFVRLPAAEVAAIVATEAPLPTLVPQVELLPVPVEGELDAQGRTRKQVLAVNRSRRRNKKRTLEAREAESKKRKARGDSRREYRAQRQQLGDLEEGEEEGEEDA